MQNCYKFSVRFCRNIFYCKTPVSAASHCNILYGNSICSISGSTLQPASVNAGLRPFSKRLSPGFPVSAHSLAQKTDFSQQDMHPRNISVFLKRTGNRMLLYHLTPGLLHFYFCSILLCVALCVFCVIFYRYQLLASDYFMVTTESQQV